MYTPLFARSFVACSLAAERARVSTRRMKKKRKEETPRKRDPRRHQALRASSLSASSCTTRTYPKIPLGETRRKTSGESALSLARIVSLRVALPNARAPRTPSLSIPIAPFPFLSPTPITPAIHSLRPLLYLPFSIRVSFLPGLVIFLPLACSLSSLSLPLLSRTFIRSLFLFPYHPRPRGKRFAGRILSPRGSRATCVLVLAPHGNAIPCSRRVPNVNGIRSPTNVRASVFIIVVAICNI